MERNMSIYNRLYIILNIIYNLKYIYTKSPYSHPLHDTVIRRYGVKTQGLRRKGACSLLFSSIFYFFLPKHLDFSRTITIFALSFGETGDDIEKRVGLDWPSFWMTETSVTTELNNKLNNK